MGSSSGRKAKEKAAAARAKAEASEKRRQRIINLTIGAVVLIVVLALVGGAWFSSRDSSDDPDTEAKVPTGALPASSEYAYGVEIAGDAPGKPVLEIWEDFQCPACAQFEALFNPTIEKMADDGKARVIWRSTSFLDNGFPGDHSKRASAAWGCAIDAGKKVEYHDLIFANQPETEGVGWTDDQLLQFGEDAGIKDDKFDTFETCVADHDYIKWANNGTAESYANEVPGTPTLYLNGEELQGEDRATPEALENAVAEAAKSDDQ
jgi:protein-disulfide isomerase